MVAIEKDAVSSNRFAADLDESVLLGLVHRLIPRNANDHRTGREKSIDHVGRLEAPPVLLDEAKSLEGFDSGQHRGTVVPLALPLVNELGKLVQTVGELVRVLQHLPVR